MQMFNGFHAVTCHVEMIGGASAVHLVDGFNDVVVNRVQIVPVVDVRKRGPSGEREAEGGEDQSFFQGTSSGSRF